MIARFLDESVFIHHDHSLKEFKKAAEALHLDNDIKVLKNGITYKADMTDGGDICWAVIPLTDGSTVFAYSCMKLDTSFFYGDTTFANMVELIKSHPGKDDHCVSFTRLFGEFVRLQGYKRKNTRAEEDMEKSRKFSALARNAVKGVSKMTSFKKMTEFVEKAALKAGTLYKGRKP